MLYTKNLSLTKFLSLFFLFLLSLKNANCQIVDYSFSVCDYVYNQNSLNDDVCFNNILTFQHKNYQLNHFAKNKNGDLVAEFAEAKQYDFSFSSRLFYGLKKDGRYLFSDESSYINEFNVDIEEQTNNEEEYFYLSNSKNLFVTIQGNQYLFSLNAYNSIVELYNLNNNDNKYQIWSLNKFFKLDENDNLLYYCLDLFELKRENAYIIAFIPDNNINPEMSSGAFIKKFKFKSFDSNAYDEIKSVTYMGYEGKSILSTFLMDDGREYTFVVVTRETK